MAWLKMQFSLWDSVEVEQIAARVGHDPDRVIGALGRVWRWFSDQTADGRAKVADGPEMAAQWIDRKGNLPGLAAGMRSVGWLDLSGSGEASIPEFERYIGSAKRARAKATIRMKEARSRNKAGQGECSPERSPERAPERSRLADLCPVSVSEVTTGKTLQVPEPSGRPGYLSPPHAWPPALDTPEIREAWADWLTVRAAKHPEDPVDAIQAEMLLKQLLSWGPAATLEALRTAAARGWKSPRPSANETPAERNTARPGARLTFQEEAAQRRSERIAAMAAYGRGERSSPFPDGEQAPLLSNGMLDAFRGGR